MSDLNSIVAICDRHSQAEQAVKELRESGVDIKTLSIVTTAYHLEQRPVGYFTAGDRIKYWGMLGAFWGGVWGLLFGGLFQAIPNITPILGAEASFGRIAGALEGALAMGALCVAAAALYSLGIPKDSVVQFAADITPDRFLVLRHGEVAESRALTVADDQPEICVGEYR